MGSIFFDIPFLTRSAASDFSCKDGEIQTGFNIPMVPDISFALVRDTLKGWHLHPDIFPAKTLVASDPSMEYWTNLGAQFLSAFQSEAQQQKLFVAPFLVMAVWKTTDGFYLSPTQPFLMIPNSEVPLVATDGDISKSELEFKIAGAVCSLYLKMKAPETLRDWVGKISSLEILVSEPLHNYNALISFLPQRRISGDARCRCLDLDSGIISERRISTDIFALAWKANVYGDLPSVDGSLTELRKKLRFHNFTSIPLSEVDLFEKWTCSIDGVVSPGTSLTTSLTYEELIASTSYPGKPSPAIIEGKGEYIDMETRPLKLSGAGEFKKVRKVFLRGNYNPSSLTVSVYGSRDMLEWWCVGKRKGGTMVILPHSSFRFYKVRIQGLLNEGFTLEGLSILCKYS